MGILDEAIREHLELKRQHGAADSELKQLEDEAFGQAERPGGETIADSLAEAPTKFMTQPETEEGEGRREPSIADLQEPPPPAEPAPEAPSEEEQPAMEHDLLAEAPDTAQAAPKPVPEAEIEAPGHTTEERQAIAEQPTEMFDVAEELGAPPAPSDEEIVEEEIAEPRLAPTDPLAGLEETEEAEATVQGPAPADDEDFEDEDDAFWNEQRLSDELDQALEAPREETSELDTDLADVEPEPETAPDQHHEEPETEDAYDDEDLEPESDELPAPVAETGHEPEGAHHEDDVLEETPDFLEEAPEDDQLWFEQKPPKDFDFDD
jgi:hypothetical protein